MSERETEYWGLFENRPARERTSLPRAEEVECDRDTEEAHVWSRRQGRPNAVAERGRC